MAVWIPLALLALVGLGTLVALLVVVLVVAPRRQRAQAAARQVPALRRLMRTHAVARGVALVVGVGVTAAAASAWSLGRGLMLAPAAFAAAQILAVLLADRATYTAMRTPGVAAIEVRRVRDYLPRALSVLAVLSAAALAASLTWTTAVAASDDLGRAGRALTYPCIEGCEARISPWPGSFYSVPLAVGLGAVVLLAVVALSVTVRRPRNGADPAIAATDDAVRRRSVETVVAAVALALSASLLGIAMVAGVRLLAAGDVPSGSSLTVGATLLTIAGLWSLAVVLWSTVSLLLPTTHAARELVGQPT
jgi:hypothetical protein